MDYYHIHVCLGVNFSLYYDALHGNIRTLLKDREFRLYIFLVLMAVVMIAININNAVYHDLGESIRQSSFHVLSITSTSGFSAVDYDLWPDFSRMILLLLMFFGACAGSTAGGIKIIRILLVLKIIRKELNRLIHPSRSSYPYRTNHSDETLQNTSSFLCCTW